MSFYLSKRTINKKIYLKEQNIDFLYLNVRHDLPADQSEHPPTLVQHNMILYPQHKRLHQVKLKMLNCIDNYIINFK